MFSCPQATANCTNRNRAVLKRNHAINSLKIHVRILSGAQRTVRWPSQTGPFRSPAQELAGRVCGNRRCGLHVAAIGLLLQKGLSKSFAEASEKIVSMEME